MADTPHTPDRRFDEEQLRNDFRFYHYMIGSLNWAIVSEPEHQQITEQIDALTDRWHAAPAPWKNHWDHLATAARRWEQNPESMQQMLDQIAGDYARTGTTDLANPIQVRNLLMAGELAEARRTDMGIGSAPGSPDHIDFVYGYLSSYRAAGHTTWASLPSWSTARRWLIDRAAATAPETRVDITITGPDPHSGAAARPLMTGTDLTAGELGDQLRHLDQLLGTAAIPLDPSTQSWLDDVRYDVLCDAYRNTLIDHANPWAVGRRFEHHLRADDLYTDIVDFTDRAGLSRTDRGPGIDAEQPDTVGSRLDEIRQGVRGSDIDWMTPPRTSTWLDEAADRAQQRVDQFTRGAGRYRYGNLTRAGHLIEIGFDEHQWYAQHIHTGEDGRTSVYDTPPSRYRSCDELVAAAATFEATPGQQPAPYVSLPDTVVREMRAFERDLSSLEHDVATVRELRDALRTGRPHTLHRNQPPTAPTPRQAGSAISRDANRITLTPTPGSERPTPPAQPAKQPPAKRRQPPKSGGRPHRRRL
ncbi:hypothetical protein [Nocardia sp. NBC_01388]|uniref:hypothetical protein n=1 Tax=Nocardia sp. NBC_01388 TaxID=2903596 RepID=UPI00324D410F